MIIHPTAIIHSSAELAEDVRVGPYCVVGQNVHIGSATELVSHVVVGRDTRMGSGNHIYPFASIGFAPQDLKYGGEPTRVEVGDGNTIREYVTVNRGTEGGGGVTRLGDDNFLMAYAHVAHDSLVGNRTIFANAASLAGHVEVQDDATVGAFSGVHQFCRVGAHGFIGGYSAANKDVLPYSRTVGNRARAYGANTIGLQRKGISEESIAAINRAFRILLSSKLNTSQALERIRSEISGVPEVDYLVRFIEESERGVVK
jgi:UDP-N-acetylglucosamine acyltransferase